ncbi:MAG: YceI family protein [Acidobacteriota bacterium]|nr:YceI family protein [Acidobacteriota bacterium]
MKRWTFEPGHTAAEFSVRHMMVTHVRGHFKNVKGSLEFDPADPKRAKMNAVIDAATLWSGEPDRDAHLKSPDFLDAANYPTIKFESDRVELVGPADAKVHGNVTIRGVTKPLILHVHYLGTWQTPWWEGGVDKGPKTRAGFVATGSLNRKDFGVNWNSTLERGGLVVGEDVELTLDAEAILEE